jgi:hypothetical protein
MSPKKELKDKFKYKLVEKLVNLRQSSNPVKSKLGDASLKSLKSINSIFSSTSSSKSLKQNEEVKQKSVRDLQNIIKNIIDEYKKKCDDYDEIISLFKTISKHTDEDQETLIKQNKYLIELSKLSCELTANEKDYLIDNYIHFLKQSKYNEKDFLKKVFNKFKTSSSSNVSNNTSRSSISSKKTNSRRSSISSKKSSTSNRNLKIDKWLNTDKETHDLSSSFYKL